jgi:hypothetical protein
MGALIIEASAKRVLTVKAQQDGIAQGIALKILAINAVLKVRIKKCLQYFM